MLKEKLVEKISFKEVCDNLDKLHNEYLSWKWKYFSTEEIWEKYKNRKSTFLTSK